MNTLEARRRLLGRNVYKRTTEGNPAIAQGSLARRYPGITMQGWTKQNRYEGKNLFDISKVIGSDNGNLKVEGNTIVVKNAQYGQTGKDPIKFSDYFPNAEIGKTYTLNFDYINRSFIYILGAGSWDANQLKVMTQEILDGRVYFYSTASEENIYSNIMLNEGTTALPYEPYTGNQPSPSPEYPQEITSAGKYNEGTGKYEYEITIANAQTDPDKNQTVTLTSDRPLTKWDRLEKRNGQWGWVYKSAEIVLDGTENYVTNLKDYVSDFSSNCYTVISNMVSDGRTNVFMNRLSNIDYSWAQPDAIGFSKNFNQLHVRISNSDLGTTGESSSSEIVDAMKAYMAQHYEDGNPFIALYETAAETFVPLTESEQEQMNALHTFRPTTVLSNDCDCNMFLTYKTKKSMEVTT